LAGKEESEIGDIGPARSLETKGILWESYAVLNEAKFVAKFTPERSK
jgi:hypothetical protein